MAKPIDLLDWKSCSNQHTKIWYDVEVCPVCLALNELGDLRIHHEGTHHSTWKPPEEDSAHGR